MKPKTQHSSKWWLLVCINSVLHCVDVCLSARPYTAARHMPSFLLYFDAIYFTYLLIKYCYGRMWVQRFPSVSDCTLGVRLCRSIPSCLQHCTSVSVWSAAPRCWHHIKTPSPRSSTSSEPIVPLSRLVTVGDRSFADIAGPRLWNSEHL